MITCKKNKKIINFLKLERFTLEICTLFANYLLQIYLYTIKLTVVKYASIIYFRRNVWQIILKK